MSVPASGVGYQSVEMLRSQVLPQECVCGGLLLLLGTERFLLINPVTLC